jgi:histidyl-tRNA synthetase
VSRSERPTPLSGFPEWLPGDRLAEQEVEAHLRRTFELAGFAPLETRAVEPLAQLLRKGEIDKEVYVVRRLHAEGDGTGVDPAAADDALALHYDLTVPFARYVLENAGRLEFPFRRYQIQKAWRGERPQEGRYREFRQADIDVVGRDTLAFHHDVEVAQVMAEALSGLPVPPITMQLNNRRLIEGFYQGLGVDDVGAVMRAVDKIDKVGPDGVRRILVEEERLSAAVVDACLQLAEIAATDASFVDRVRGLGVRSDLLDTGLEELAQVVEGAAEAASDRVTVVADLRIARGLDYYTGTVYETRMQGFESLGSICSGGRYDSLATDGRTTYPGVGISFGVTRTLGPLFARGLVRASRATPTCVLVAVPDEDQRAGCRSVATALRARGVPSEVSPSAAKYGRQIRYAERRGIPFVWFPSAATQSGLDEVRDIRSGEQVAAEPGQWLPPADDLVPRLLSGE